jgi:choline-sulfatase
MLRRGRFKYVAFREGPELLFDLWADPDEQRNLAPDPSYAATLAGLRAETLAGLRAETLAGFDFEEVAERMQTERENLRRRFPMRMAGRTPNQLLMPDGRLLEGDAALYAPTVVAQRLADVVDDFPGGNPARPGPAVP